MPHASTKGRTPAVAALTVALLACTGLAACGGSSSTSTQTTANAAATGTTTTGTTKTGTTPSGTSSTGAAPAGRPNPARFAAMRACLAKKGITLPPRTPGAGGFLGGGPQLPKGVTRAQYAEALKACGGNFPGRGHFSRVPHAFTSPRFHAGARPLRRVHAPERDRRGRTQHLGQRPGLRHQRTQHRQHPVQSGRGEVPEHAGRRPAGQTHWAP